MTVTGETPTVAGAPAPVGISSFLAAHPIPTVLFGYGLVNHIMRSTGTSRSRT